MDKKKKERDPPLWWEVFVTEYLKNSQDATNSYIKARPEIKPNSAKVAACRLLTNDNFKAFLLTRRQKLVDSQDMTRERWMSLLCDIAGCDIRNYLTLEPETGDVQLAKDWKTRKDGHAIEAVNLRTTTLESGQVVQRVDLKRESKLKALELLGKSLGYVNDKLSVEHSGSIELINPYKDEP